MIEWIIGGGVDRKSSARKVIYSALRQLNLGMLVKALGSIHPLSLNYITNKANIVDVV